MSDHSIGRDGSEPASTRRDPDVAYDIDETEPPSRAVVRAVAAVTDTEPIDLDPLYDVVDPDHLDGLLAGAGDGDAIADGSVTFDFNGCRVTATQDTVFVRAVDQSPV